MITHDKCGISNTSLIPDHEGRSSQLVWGTRVFSAFLFVAATFVSPVSQAILITETFEDETNQATSFSEASGPAFSVSGDLMVEEFSGLGSGMSDRWLGTGFGGGGNGTGGSLGNVGTMTVATGWSFVINSFDAWMGQNDGNNFIAPADVRFIGTKIDDSMVEAILSFNTPDDFNFELGRDFGGTALQNMALKSLSFELITSAPFDYLAFDNISIDARLIPTPPPPNGIPEPATLALMTLGVAGICYSRKRKAA